MAPESSSEGEIESAETGLVPILRAAPNLFAPDTLYLIGTFWMTVSTNMAAHLPTLCPRNSHMDRSLIEAYVTGPAKLRAAVAGLTREDLTARPGPGAWSILEVVVHIADSDAISIDRMKRMLSEDNPPLLYADETAYVQRLHTHDQDIEDALTLLEVGRRQWARVLRLLPDEAFARSGQHNRRGTVTAGGYVASYIDHIDDHLKFIEGKRANLGKTLPCR